MIMPKTNNDVQKFKSIEIIEFKDAENFIDYLRPTKGHWGKEVPLNWCFRGHGNAEWLLQPFAWRAEGQKILRPISKRLKPDLKFRWGEIKRSIGGVWLENEDFAFRNILHLSTNPG